MKWRFTTNCEIASHTSTIKAAGGHSDSISLNQVVNSFASKNYNVCYSKHSTFCCHQQKCETRENLNWIQRAKTLRNGFLWGNSKVNESSIKSVYYGRSSGTGDSNRLRRDFVRRRPQNYTRGQRLEEITTISWSKSSAATNTKSKFSSFVGDPQKQKKNIVISTSDDSWADDIITMSIATLTSSSSLAWIRIYDFDDDIIRNDYFSLISIYFLSFSICLLCIVLFAR